MEATELRAQLCAAIRRRSLVMFEYGDLIRVVEPHRFGINSAGHEMLSGWLRAGYSRSDPAGGWRNYLVSDVSALQVLDAPFAGTRPGYVAPDPRMREVYCELDPADAATPARWAVHRAGARERTHRGERRRRSTRRRRSRFPPRERARPTAKSIHRPPRRNGSRYPTAFVERGVGGGASAARAASSCACTAAGPVPPSTSRCITDRSALSASTTSSENRGCAAANDENGKRLQLATRRLALAHESPDRAVRLAEGRTLSNEIVREIRRHHRARERGAHALGPEPTFARARPRRQEAREAAYRSRRRAHACRPADPCCSSTAAPSASRAAS